MMWWWWVGACVFSKEQRPYLHHVVLSGTAMGADADSVPKLKVLLGEDATIVLD